MILKAECPSCFYTWEDDYEDIVAGEVVTCPDCGVDLEVTSIGDGSMELEVLGAADEDWGE